MIPKRSWVTLVPDVIYENLNNTPDVSTIKIPVTDWIGNNPTPGDTIYLIKSKTDDKYKDSGIFCATTLLNIESGFVILSFEKDEVLTQKNSSYIRFDSVNLKDSYLRGIKTKANNLGAAYFLDNSTSVRLETLFCKTDVTFTPLDAKISLLAYEESFAAGISPESSTFTVKAAIECGRLVSSISTKMSNYKHLDPRVEGGLKNGAKIDKITWEEYYLPSMKKVDIMRLRQDIANESKDYEFTFVVEDNSEPASEPNIPNDENKRQAYARRVRKGQSRFRKALITLYDTRCAFTKTNEETVLEACHIISHARTGDNSLDNGLLLRSDIHVLFDEHLVTLANDGITVCVRQDVTAPEYAKLNNSVAQTRPSVSERYLNLIRQRNSELNWLK
jgi:HNH endonuclease